MADLVRIVGERVEEAVIEGPTLQAVVATLRDEIASGFDEFWHTSRYPDDIVIRVEMRRSPKEPWVAVSGLTPEGE